MKKPILFISFVFVIIVGLSIVQVTVSNGLSTTGIELSKIEEKIQSYRRENALLAETLYTESAYHEIASKAAAMGYAFEKSHVVITNPLPIASHHE